MPGFRVVSSNAHNDSGGPAYPLKAIEHLKMLHLLDQKDDRYAKRIARLYRDLNDGPNAEAWGLQAVYMDPYDMDAHEFELTDYPFGGAAIDAGAMPNPNW